MVRLMAILAGVACAALAGCRGHENDTALHGASVKEGIPCLVNLSSGLAACNPATSGQRRLVLIRNVVLPVGEQAHYADAPYPHQHFRYGTSTK